MEILLGFLASGVTELIKILSNKFGQELSAKIVNGVVLVLCLVGTYLITTGYLTMDIINKYLQIFVTAYATYNLIIKPTKAKLGVK